jgi:hypothetical protein
MPHFSREARKKMAIAEKDHVRKESKPVVGGLPVTLAIQGPTGAYL